MGVSVYYPLCVLCVFVCVCGVGGGGSNVFRGCKKGAPGSNGLS